MQTILQFKHYLVGSKEVESLDNVVALRKENVGERFAGLEPRDFNFEKKKYYRIPLSKMHRQLLPGGKEAKSMRVRENRKREEKLSY